MLRGFLASCLLVPALLSLTGCGGGGPARTQVSGKVTFNNAPVALGHITFTPDPATNATGLGGNAPIKDGAYDTRQGQAPSTGAMVVQINGFDGKANADQPNGNPIFFWEEKASLAADTSTKDFAVPANAPKTPTQPKGKTIIIP